MFCMNCGTQLPDGAKFCMNCGTKVGEVGAGAVPAGKKYPSYAMLYPDSMAYLESPAYQRERGLMKQSELGATPYAGLTLPTMFRSMTARWSALCSGTPRVTALPRTSATISTA